MATVNAKLRADRYNKVKNLIQSKMRNGSAEIKYTGKNKVAGFGYQDEGCKDFIFAHGSDGWTVYQGCELLVGDTSLLYCIAAMFNQCNESF